MSETRTSEWREICLQAMLEADVRALPRANRVAASFRSPAAPPHPVQLYLSLRAIATLAIFRPRRMAR